MRKTVISADVPVILEGSPEFVKRWEERLKDEHKD